VKILIQNETHSRAASAMFSDASCEFPDQLPPPMDSAHIGFKVVASMDHDPMCKRVIKALHAKIRPVHLFNDMLDVLAMPLRMALLAAQARNYSSFQQACGDAIPRGAETMPTAAVNLLTKSGGEAMMNEFEDLFSRWGEEAFRTHGPCEMCDSSCPFFDHDPEAEPDVITCNVSGAECVDFSTMAAQAQWMGPSALNWLTWMFFVHARAIHVGDLGKRQAVRCACFLPARCEYA
jgi:hypothetical protein